jgi:hypothetical protein
MRSRNRCNLVVFPLAFYFDFLVRQRRGASSVVVKEVWGWGVVGLVRSEF